MRKLLTILLLPLFVNAQVPKEYFGEHFIGPTETNLGGSGKSTLWPPWNPTAVRLWDVTGFDPNLGFAYSSLSWRSLNPSNGTYYWYVFDKTILKMKEKGVTDLIYTLGYVPSWAGGGTNGDQNPSSQSYITTFLTAVANRAISLGLPIKYWEVWNEPNNGSGTWVGTTAQMVTIAQTVSNAVKAVDASYKVLTPCPQGYGTTWMSGFLSAGGGAYCDIMAFHGYMFGHAPEDIATLIDDYKSVFSAHGQSGKEIWNTESYRLESNDLADADQVNFLAVTHLLGYVKGLSRYYWYTWDGSGTTGQEWKYQNYTGGVTGITATGIAHQQIINWMLGGVVDNLTINGNVYTIRIRNYGKTYEVVWNKSGSSSYSTSYTRYNDLAGNTTTISGSVTIGKAPILLFTPTTGNYYVSENGDDSRTATQAQNPLTPWKTISKINASTFNSGDSVLFKRGETFYGKIIVPSSGIKFGAYGTGAKPIITGLTQVSSWTSLGGNIWESAAITTSLTSMNMVTVNDVFTPRGRYPNADAANEGWNTIDAHTSTTLVDTTAGAMPSWATGATVHARYDRWLYGTGVVTSKPTSTSIAFSSSSLTALQNGWGWFLDNHVSTLNKQGEWYFNPTTKKLRMYSTTNPGSTVKGSTGDYLVTGTSKSNISFSDIDFNGSNADGITISGGSGWTFTDCKISNITGIGLFVSSFSGFHHLTVTRDTLKFIGNKGIETNNNFTTIQDSHFEDIAMNHGYIGGGEGFNGNAIAGRHIDSFFTVQRSTFKRIGMSGVGFKNDINQDYSNYIYILYNEMDSVNMNKDDDGGIYTVQEDTNHLPYHHRYIIGNKITNALGNYYGTWYPNGLLFSSGGGIYLDRYSENIHADSNDVEGSGRYGMFWNYGVKNCTAIANILINNGTKMLTDLRGCQFFFNEDARRIRNNVIKQNQMWAFGTQNLIYSANKGSETLNPGIMDSNYYAVFSTKTTAWKMQTSAGTTNRNWSQWKGLGFDNRGDTILTTSTSVIKTDYASSGLVKVVNLSGYKWIDPKKQTYSQFVVLPPYRSIALKRGTLDGQAPPSVSIYSPLNNQSITSNTNIIIGATASDADGTIASVKFYQGTTLLSTDNASPYSYTWANVAPGDYTLTAVATDNDGLTTTSSPVLIHVVNSKPSVSLTAPTSGATYTTGDAVNMTATASDANGTITKINFYVDGSFVGTDNSSPYTTSWTSTQGGHSLTAVAVDNLGDSTTSASISITVSTTNQVPTVSITLPTKDTSCVGSASIHFTAIASDPDGTVVNVRFYDNLVFFWNETAAPWDMTRTISGVGVHTITAVAIDNSGDSTRSAPRYITITSPNIKPTGSITFPNSDSSFEAPATFDVTVTASDADGTVSAVHLYKNGVFAGSDASSPYSFTQTSLPEGGYSFYAWIIDNLGDSTQTNTINPTVITPATPGTDSLAASVQITSPILCNGGQGTIVVSATGGQEPYTGTGTFTKTGGFWEFPIEDANGLKDTARISLYEPGALSATVDTTAITTYGGSSIITTNAIGGTPAYSYSINGTTWQTSNMFSVKAGTYTIQVKDANACTTSVTFTVHQPAPSCNCIIRGKKKIIYL